LHTLKPCSEAGLFSALAQPPVRWRAPDPGPAGLPGQPAQPQVVWRWHRDPHRGGQALAGLGAGHALAPGARVRPRRAPRRRLAYGALASAVAVRGGQVPRSSCTPTNPWRRPKFQTSPTPRVPSLAGDCSSIWAWDSRPNPPGHTGPVEGPSGRSCTTTWPDGVQRRRDGHAGPVGHLAAGTREITTNFEGHKLW
jgi:hypothetical protein